MNTIGTLPAVTKTKYLKKWATGSSYSDIGNIYKISRQAAKIKVDKEISDVIYQANLKQTLDEICYKKDGTLYSYLDFSSHIYGKMLAYLAKRFYGYHIVDHVFCSIEKKTVTDIRAEIFKKTKNSIPYKIRLYPEDNIYAFDDISFFATKPTWSSFFVVADYKGVSYIMGYRNEKMLYNICLWIKSGIDLEVSEIFNFLPDEFKRYKGVETMDDLIEEAKKSRRYLYNIGGPCKKKILDIIPKRKRGRKPANSEEKK